MFTPAPASPKQIRFITNLVHERELTDEQRHDLRMRVNREMTGGQARGIIESLLLLPKKASGRPAAAAASRPAAPTFRVWASSPPSNWPGCRTA